MVSTCRMYLRWEPGTGNNIKCMEPRRFGQSYCARHMLLQWFIFKRIARDQRNATKMHVGQLS